MVWAGVFGTWYLVMTGLVLRAIHRKAEEGRSACRSRTKIPLPATRRESRNTFDPAAATEDLFATEDKLSFYCRPRRARRCIEAFADRESASGGFAGTVYGSSAQDAALAART